MGVNLTWLVPGVVGGSEEATVTALLAASEVASSHGLDLVGFGSDALVDAHPTLAEALEWVSVPWATESRVQRVVGDNRRLAGVIDAHDIDVVHHGGGVIPPLQRWRQPQSLTIHDVQPLDLPENFAPSKRWYMRAVLARSARRASRIAVPSEFVAGRVVATCGVAADRVAVVPWAAPSPPVAVSAETSRAVGRLHGVGTDYVLYPAITHPHKNHLLLIAALERMHGDVDLVLCGGEGAAEPQVLAAIARSPVSSRIHRIGRIGRSDLEALYAGAAAVAVPSRYEGFGLPALEAMVRGVPLAASSAGSLGEVAGELATLSPDDPAQWAARLDLLTGDPAARALAIDTGSVLASRFTAARTGGALVDLWCGMAGGLRSSRPL